MQTTTIQSLIQSELDRIDWQQYSPYCTIEVRQGSETSNNAVVKATLSNDTITGITKAVTMSVTVDETNHSVNYIITSHRKDSVIGLYQPREGEVGHYLEFYVAAAAVAFINLTQSFAIEFKDMVTAQEQKEQVVEEPKIGKSKIRKSKSKSNSTVRDTP